MKYGLLKIKVKARGVKVLAEENKECKLKEWEELFKKAEKVALSAKKGKGKEKTIEKHYEEFKKKKDELSPLEDKVVEKP